MTIRNPRRSTERRPAPQPIDLGNGYTFMKEGEYWTIAYQGTVFRRRDAKGLRYLACLLGHPGQRFGVRELVTALGGSGGVVSDLPTDPSPDADHARSAVTKRIKAAIEKIAEHHPSLGHHLSTCVNTGYQCAYTRS